MTQNYILHVTMGIYPMKHPLIMIFSTQISIDIVAVCIQWLFYFFPFFNFHFTTCCRHKGRVTHWIKEFRVGKGLVQILLGLRMGFGTQPFYLCDLWVDVSVRNTGINIGLVKLSPRQWSKVGSGAAKQQIKKEMGQKMTIHITSDTYNHHAIIIVFGMQQ